MTPDRARCGGHYYSDKAPGTAALALPALGGASAAVQAQGVELDSETGWLVTSWAACAFSQALPAAIGAARLLPRVTDEGWFFDTELLWRAQRAGLRIAEIPVRWVEDRDTRVRLGPTIWRDVHGVWRLRRETR